MQLRAKVNACACVHVRVCMLCMVVWEEKWLRGERVMDSANRQRGERAGWGAGRVARAAMAVFSFSASA